jgi:16S rRNA (cytidine1402-2'-O)-methyltransferase
VEQLLKMSREDANFARGEITVVVAGAEAEAAPDDAFVARAYDLLSAELPPSRAASLVAQLTGRRKADIYARGIRGGAARNTEDGEQ